MNAEDIEADKVHAAGLIIKDLPLLASNFRQTRTLSEYLVAEKTVAIANIDTRKLTRLLRSKGAQNGAIVGLAAGEAVTSTPSTRRSPRLRVRPACPGWTWPRWSASLRPSPGRKPNGSYRTADGKPGYGTQDAPEFHVVAYDFGVKKNILRMLAERGCKVTVVPAQTTAKDVLDLNPDGIFLSNGPGDPEPCDYAIAATAELIETGIPTFGICLGHQIMALASGAKTFKMKFGHHGANHPVKDLDNGRVSITSQNHGFAVDEKTLGPNLRATHVSLFDGTLQGLARTDKPAFCFQGHPEASPGPHDIAYLFDRFTALMETHKNA